ncbi:MAG TPA: response regulator, partial [Gemmataceae bacterium]|nr:response regulator [Gemmataceae bacterium]
MPTKPRILVLASPAHAAEMLEQLGPADRELIRADSLARGVELLRTEHFDGVYIDTQDPAGDCSGDNLLQARHILETLPDGVAVVGADLKIDWSNPAFDRWSGGPARGRPFYEALGSPEILGPDYSPFHTALAGKIASTRLHCSDNRYLELHVTPVQESGQPVRRLITLARDVTAEVQQQHKLDALHWAGQELADLDPNQLAEMSPEERIELLKANIRRFTHDLLKYDVIEIRLLDPQTGRLEPLLQEGMTPEAGGRVLYARAEDNGVTGFVAATGKSYLCPDTATDPLYIEGARGARSSLTVPLIVQDQVIGTFNVESPQPNAFGEQDVQFAEIFSRQLAGAIHTLELLSAEKWTAATQSVEAISREVALPVDDILTAATAVLDRYIGHDAEMADKLKRIIAGARSLKQCIQKVGEDLAPPKPPAGATPPAHPHLRGLRVLVVDNDERVRKSAHSILGRFGCVVETARDGREALTMARLSSYDAILADIRLPDINGYEAFQQLRQIQPQARTILMTAYGYDPSHSLVKARQEGLRSVLYKPFRIDQLLDALENPDGTPPSATAQPA